MTSDKEARQAVFTHLPDFDEVTNLQEYPLFNRTTHKTPDFLQGLHMSFQGKCILYHWISHCWPLLKAVEACMFTKHHHVDPGFKKSTQVDKILAVFPQNSDTYDNLLLKYGTIIDHPKVYLHPPSRPRFEKARGRRYVAAVGQSYGMWDAI